MFGFLWWAEDLFFHEAGDHPIGCRNKDTIKHELQDILDLFRTCDEACKTLPRFAAEAFDPMPPAFGFEAVSLTLVAFFDKIAALREEIRLLKESRREEVSKLEDYIDIREQLSDI